MNLIENKIIIEQFYSALVAKKANEMVLHYHDDIVFKDPAFGTLKGAKAKAMWQMLISKMNDETVIEFDIIECNHSAAKVNWKAKYAFGKKKRIVNNHITSYLTFNDNKIITHYDNFNLWKWSQQAIGLSGYLLGWSAYFRSKIQRTTNKQLDKFIN